MPNGKIEMGLLVVLATLNSFNPMILKRVIYELFESDFGALCGRANSAYHEIDREIYLEFETGQKYYFSWCSEPEQYCIGFKPERFNKNEPERIIDASSWQVWHALIGQEISFMFTDETHQILELKSLPSSVYLSSQERGSWGADVLHISKVLPLIIHKKGFQTVK